MARISRFEKINSDRTTLHKTEVDCGYAVVELGGRTYLHLETYGSSDRKIPGKVSQTLQLDAERAAELRRLIERAFPNA